jgi:RHS repeat-associated protein
MTTRLRRWLARTDRFWAAVLARLSRRFPADTSRRPVRPRLEPVEDRVNPDLTPAFGLGVGAAAVPGSPGLVRVTDARWDTVRTLRAYAPGFTGDIATAVADVTGDGVADVVTAAGAGGGPHVKVFDGVSGQVVRDWMAYGIGFKGGVAVAAADLDGDGQAEVVTGAGPGGGPHVKVFAGATGTLAREWRAYDIGFAGGVGDGSAAVATGARAGGGPHVKMFRPDGVERAAAFAFEPTFAGGVSVLLAPHVAAPAVYVGAGDGGGPDVRVLNPLTGAEIDRRMVGDPQGRGGVRIARRDATEDGVPDVVGQAGAATAVVFDGAGVRGPGLGDQFAAGQGAKTRGLPAVVTEAVGGLPVLFEANQGQVDRAVDYVARGSGYTLFLTATEVALAARSETAEELPGDPGRPGRPRPKKPKWETVRFKLAGGNPHAVPTADGETDARVNYQAGDPSTWVTGVRTYTGVTYRGVYPGIDVRYRAADSGAPETDYLVAAGADVGRIRVTVTGATGLSLDAAGNLVVALRDGRVTQSAPVAYQVDAAGRRQPVAAGFELEGTTVRVRVGEYDRGRPLVVDPEWGYGTYVGGTADDGIYDIAVDAAGNAYVTGYSLSSDFPGQWLGKAYGTQQVMAAKLSADGRRLVYLSIFGGKGEDVGYGIAVDSSGRAVITGQTVVTEPGINENDFPVSVGAVGLGQTQGTNKAGFLTRLTEDGLVDPTGECGYSAYLGSYVWPSEVAVDGQGRATLVGRSGGYLPMEGTKRVYGTPGATYAFAARLTETGKAAEYQTLLTGTYGAGATSVTISGGATYVGGTADKSDGFLFDPDFIPASNTLDVGFVAGLTDGVKDFVVGNMQAGSSVYDVAAGGVGVYATYVSNGTGLDTHVSAVSAGGYSGLGKVAGAARDEPGGLAVGSDGVVTLVGTTWSDNLKTTNKSAFADGTTDAYVARFATGLGDPLFLSYLGGDQEDYGASVAVNADHFYAAGTTKSEGLFSSGVHTHLAGGFDGFITKGAPPPKDFVPLVDPATGPRSPGLGRNDFGVGAPVRQAGGSAVRAADGAIAVAAVDLTAAGYDGPFGMTRQWTNAAGVGPDGLVGVGWASGLVPWVRKVGDTLLVYESGYLVEYFDPVPGSTTEYKARHFSQHTLTASEDPSRLKYRDRAGREVQFYGFGAGVSGTKKGRFLRAIDPYGDANGHVTEVPLVSEMGDGKVREIKRTIVDGPDVTEWWKLKYVDGGVNQGLLESVTLQRQAGVNGPWQTVRRVEYTYYEGGCPPNEPNGITGALKRVVLKESDAVGAAVLHTSYYRYYTSDAAGGYTGGLRLALSGDAYLRAAAVSGNIDTASDDALRPYADWVLAYDTKRRVTAVTRGIEGVSAQAGAFGQTTLEYKTSGFAAGYNSWATKTIETLADGGRVTVYANAYAQPMLVVRTAGGKQWIDFFRYDAQGRLLVRAHPSAVTGFNEGYPDLVGYANAPGGFEAIHLATTQGLIETTAWAGTTTATAATAGDVAGYRQSAAVRQGTGGVPAPQWAGTYIANATPGVVTYWPVTDTVYRFGGGFGAQTTKYAYEWHSGGVNPVTQQVYELTVTLPAVTTTQNGPGTPSTRRTRFDHYGRVVYTQDEGGYVHAVVNDLVTGAVTTTVGDTAAPDGWPAPPLGVRANQTDQYEVDALGRTTKATDPNLNVTYTVYKDAAREVRVYPGWVAAGANSHPTGPIQILRNDPGQRYSEAIRIAVPPTLDATFRPTGAEAIGSVQALSRTVVDIQGRTQFTDEYTDLTGLAYTPAVTIGAAGTNYLRTQYAYDPVWRPTDTTSPGGRVDRTTYDTLGRVTATLAGKAGTSLTQLSATEYDNNQVGDGLPTKVTVKPGNGRADRVTQTAYDFRWRAVAVKDGVEATEAEGVNRPLTQFTYDNLDQTLTANTYDGDTVTPSAAPPAASRLRAATQLQHDNAGRTYATHAQRVDQATGEVGGTPLTSRGWFDRRGLTAATQTPDGRVVKTASDGLARQTASHLTDGRERPTGTYGVWGINSPVDGSTPFASGVTVTVNGGDPSYAPVTALSVGFPGLATVDPGAFTLTGPDEYGNLLVVTPSFSTATVNGATVVYLSLWDSQLNYGALWDGTWTLYVDTSKVAVQNVAFSWTDAVTLAGDIVWTQAESKYDDASNLIKSTARERIDGQTTTGDLTGTSARSTYAGYYYDALHRPTAAVDAGTNNGSDWSRPPLPPSPFSGWASFVGSSTAPQGSWVNHYGDEGHWWPIYGTGNELPSYATVQVSGAGENTWGADDNDARYLENGLNRIAPYWYTTASSMMFDLTLADGMAHKVSLYVLDEDQIGRSQKMEVLDAATGTLLDAQTVAGFGDGRWLSWDVAGHVQIRVTTLGPANAVVSGLFFDSSAATPPYTPNPNGELVTSTTYADDGLPRDVIDPRGIVTRTARDLLGRPTTVTAAHNQPEAFPTAYGYDTGGRLESVTAPGARTTKYAYDEFEFQSKVTERSGLTGLERTTASARDYLGGLVSVTDPAGTKVTYAEDVLGRPVGQSTAFTGPAGTTVNVNVTSGFDVFGRPTSVTDPRVKTTAYVYDDVLRQVTATDAATNKWVQAFDKAGRTTRVTDPFSKTTTSAYDPTGRLVSVTDPNGHAGTVKYWVNGNQHKALDALGHSTKQEFDRFGRVTAAADGLGNTTKAAYDPNGNVTLVTDANLVGTAYQYDGLNRRTAVIEAVSKTEERITRYAFHPTTGDLTRVTEAADTASKRVREFAYDSAGRQTQVTLAVDTSDAFVTTTQYDILDRPTLVTRPGSRTTRYEYDELHAVTKTTEGVGTSLVRSRTFEYDPAHNRTRVAGPLVGQETKYEFDNLNRVTLTTDALGGTVRVAFDKASRRTSLIDQTTTNESKWAYDDAGRMTLATDPLGKTTKYAYDQADRLTQTTDRLGRVTVFGYDDADRKTSEAWYATLGGTKVQEQKFAYDPVNNLTSVTDPDGDYTLAYDHLNRVSDVYGPFDTDQSFWYDVFGNRTLATLNSTDTAVTSQYDHLNRLTEREQKVNGTKTAKAVWTYDSKGDRTGLTRSTWDGANWKSSGSSTYGFDDLGRTTSITHKNAAGATTGGFGYEYDAADRLTKQVVVNGATTTYQYDLTNQLTGTDGTPFAFGYDLAGNRKDGGYATTAGNRVQTDGTWSYVYDDAGQMKTQSKSGEHWTYAYDHRGQLVQAEKRANAGGSVTDSVSYQYDAWGNRIRRDQTGGTTNTEKYVVDGWDPAKPAPRGTENFDVVADLNGSDAVTARRLFGAGFDEVVARQAGGVVSWYGTDRQGSVTQLFDTSGNQTASQTYSAFGAVTAGGGLDRYAYTAAGTDPLTGLVGDRRGYDPSIGRWTSEDPIGFDGGDANLHRYVGNGPTNATDPSGLQFPPRPIVDEGQPPPVADKPRIWRLPEPDVGIPVQPLVGANGERLQVVAPPVGADEFVRYDRKSGGYVPITDRKQRQWYRRDHQRLVEEFRLLFEESGQYGQAASFSRMNQALDSIHRDMDDPNSEMNRQFRVFAKELPHALGMVGNTLEVGFGALLLPVLPPVGALMIAHGADKAITTLSTDHEFYRQTGRAYPSMGGVMLAELSKEKDTIRKYDDGEMLYDSAAVIVDSAGAVYSGLVTAGRFASVPLRSTAPGVGASAEVAIQRATLGSMEHASEFARANFSGRFVSDTQLINLERSLQEAYRGRGMRFEGIAYGSRINQFEPIIEEGTRRVVGGRILLTAERDAVRWIDLVDETSHAVDALNPRVMNRLEGLMASARAEMAAASEAEVDVILQRIREQAHSELFGRAADRIRRGDSVMGTIASREDAALLARYARRYRR